MFKKVLYIVLIQIMLFPGVASAQTPEWKADSWADVFKNKSGTITAIWYELDPFIYQDKDGKMNGIEYEVMESLKLYLKNKYAIDLTINWLYAGSFENVYSQIKKSKQSGVFGWSHFSITSERKQEVKFTAPYMPDLNVLVTNNTQPIFATAPEFTNQLSKMEAVTVEGTTMEEDVEILKKFYQPLKVTRQEEDYAVLKQVEATNNAFGYAPLSVYILGLQDDIKVKRQNVLISRREGIAAVLSPNSDWASVVNEYFNTTEFKILVLRIFNKYLGKDVTDLVFGASAIDSLANIKSDLDLVTMEKEIATQRYIDAALESQREKIFRNSIIIGALIALIFALILYGRYVSKRKFAKLLQQRNETIVHQKEEIEMMNKRLEMKVLLSQMNPHLIFNSLNAIQYFVTLDDKKNAIRYITTFSRHLRLMLNNASLNAVTVENEVKMLQQYLQLEQLRFENKFDFDINQNLNGNTIDELEIPPMLIYPYVEAALYQGVLVKKEGRGYIKINFKKHAGNLMVTVVNNGDGSEAARNFLSKREGKEFNNSINTALQHIELLNYHQNKKVTVQQDDIVQNSLIVGSRVVIGIPVNDST